MENLMNQEGVMAAYLVGIISGMILFALGAVILRLFDKIFYKPFTNRNEPLRYNPDKK